MKVTDAAHHLYRVDQLFFSGAYLEGLRLMVRWRTAEIERTTDARYSESDIDRLANAALYILRSQMGEQRLVAGQKALSQQIIGPMDQTLCKWTVLWGMRLAALSSVAKVEERIGDVSDPTLRSFMKGTTELDVAMLVGPVDRQLVEAGFPRHLLNAPERPNSTKGWDRSFGQQDDWSGNRSASAATDGLTDKILLVFFAIALIAFLVFIAGVYDP